MSKRENKISKEAWDHLFNLKEEELVLLSEDDMATPAMRDGAKTLLKARQRNGLESTPES